MTGNDVHRTGDLAFPQSLPEFQQRFPDDAACAAYLERARWGDGFVCPYCGVVAEPFRIATRPGILECRTCRRQTGLLAGTVMERSHTPLNIWFWAAYLVASRPRDYPPFSFSGNSGCRATRRPLAFSTSCALAWCVPIRTASAANPTGMLRLMKPTSAAGRVAKAGAFITRSLLPVLSKFATASQGLARTSGRMADTPDESGWRSPPIEAQSRFVDLSRTPLLRARSSSRTIGAATPDCVSAATTTRPLSNVAIRKWPTISCPSSISYSPTSRRGYSAPITGSAQSIYKPTSTSLRSASTGVSTRSTRSVPCSESRVPWNLQPLPSFILATGCTLHLVGVCVNRIGEVASFRQHKNASG